MQKSTTFIAPGPVLSEGACEAVLNVVVEVEPQPDQKECGGWNCTR